MNRLNYIKKEYQHQNSQSIELKKERGVQTYLSRLSTFEEKSNFLTSFEK